MNRRFIVIGACAAAAIAAFTFQQSKPPNEGTQVASAPSGAMVDVQLPQLEGNALIGQRIFESACAACHGTDAAGTEGVAPPLIHKIYEPSHHGDEAFQRAAALGVKAHHWRFGDMPTIEGLTRGDVTMIVTYIRELQRANGIN